MATDQPEGITGSELLDERVRRFEATWKATHAADLSQFVLPQDHRCAKSWLS